ncbi:unnamed protein product [Leptidea sinapis]|uniref:RING-type domain-containing protein n=1 Tax=Leptidea sinapis TaxID=189913 RepID=A0A5E4PQU2_9NEOP|nr:unnamed protein product [Leptidea sinapis]
MQTSPCGHRVVCRRCFVKTIQMAVSQRLLPLRCVICRAKILRLRQAPRLVTSKSWQLSNTSSRTWGVPGSVSSYSARLPDYQVHSYTGGPAPESSGWLPPIREFQREFREGRRESTISASTSTRIRCAQKIVTQLEISPQHEKLHFFRPLKPEGKDEPPKSRDQSKETERIKETPKAKANKEDNKKKESDPETPKKNEKSKKDETSDNKKNELAERKKEEKLRLKAEKEAKKEAKLQAKKEEMQAKQLAKEEERQAKLLAKEEKKKAKKEAKLAAQAEKEKNK